jgi:hypothetical protein
VETTKKRSLLFFVSRGNIADSKLFGMGLYQLFSYCNLWCLDIDYPIEFQKIDLMKT